MGSSTLRIARLALYLLCTFALMPVQGLGLVLRRKWAKTLPAVYHRWCCRILGFRVRTIGAPTTQRPALFASNHISYTDISVLGSLIAGSFVAKSEVAGWPFFGWLAKLQRSVFVDRQIRSTLSQREALGARLAAGDALILFPEGTSGDGSHVLPFKSALFGAIDRSAAAPVAVQPVSIAYTRLDGIPLGRLCRPYFAWYGTVDLAPHIWSMAGLGTVEVVVEFHPPTFLVDCGSRKALAQYCRDRICGGVAAAISGRPQPVPDPPVRGGAAEAIAG
ncbi:MAG TPA: lysophospholipid acyltransferase family protein [Stellaceae bacterium]|jgi:1-acyl-sn-glycerol-3-phosphate acyltransferase